ncbi:MAG TPA: hypothetical protein VEY10_15135 [Flavisolibacter sp.]|jgi:hypothetical protein|nr:hypothetical protein [Flavisolibacter sp.]
MDINVPFIFRNTAYRCAIYFDTSVAPCYVFAVLDDKELIKEFGEDVSIKTDFKTRLPKQDDYQDLVVLREVIFDAVKGLPEFIAKRRLANGIVKHLAK